MTGERGLCCPVCKARFRGAAECSRCGADLTALMLLVAQAYALRQAARQTLRSGAAQNALASARAAQSLHSTAEGDVLQSVCGVLANCPAQLVDG
jgi:2-keto-3-deoxy-galactonokinase